MQNSFSTSKFFRIERLCQTRLIFSNRFCRQLIQEVAGSREEIVPPFLRLQLGQDPCTGRFLFGLWQLCQLSDGVLQDFTHRANCNAGSRVASYPNPWVGFPLTAYPP
jgi:hypothetical protein